MSQDLSRPAGNAGAVTVASGDDRQYLTLTIADQLFGIPVMLVRDVLGPQRITRVPLAAREVAGSLNLRGRIVTAIDVRCRMDLPPRADDQKPMNVVVDSRGETYSLLVDQVGEVLTLSAAAFEPSPASVKATWGHVSLGVYRLAETLMLVLDVDRLLDLEPRAAA